MAAPHVAGAWADLKETAPTASVSHDPSALQSTGKPITDTDNEVTKPRIRRAERVHAARRHRPRAGADFILPKAALASEGVSLATRAGAPATGTITSTASRPARWCSTPRCTG